MDPLKWQEDGLWLLDQTKLPTVVEYIHCKTYQDVAVAIKTMVVRGAPAIGITAAYGMALGARQFHGLASEFDAYMAEVKDILAQTRPTAVNLFWALERINKKLCEIRGIELSERVAAILTEAQAIHAEDLAANKQMGSFGNTLIPSKARILTHCNAGALATAGYGTALGLIRAAHDAGKEISVFADETRPLLQGARLTAWELMQDNIPVTLISDNMAGYLMAKGMVDLVVVGADRIAANGDVANKIGTYGVAVLAKEHRIPFYVAAPTSTIDLTISSGEYIPIEERAHLEVTHLGGSLVAPEGVKVWNPAFDITPNHLITAIITEKGIYRCPYNLSLRGF